MLSHYLTLPICDFICGLFIWAGVAHEHLKATINMPSALHIIAALVALPAVASHVSVGASKLGAYDVDINATSVSGLSSGGYFAVQMAVAFSSTIVGGAIFAGGPYHCAKGSVATALTTCMQAVPQPKVQTYVAATESAFASGTIDDPTSMLSQRYYVFSGTEDITVSPKVAAVLDNYLNEFVADSGQVLSVFNTTAGKLTTISHYKYISGF